MAKHVPPQPPITASVEPIRHDLAVGDAVLIRGRVVAVGPGDSVQVSTHPVDLQGSAGYQQTIVLYDGLLAERE